jgi:hypothetical protein
MILMNLVAFDYTVLAIAVAAYLIGAPLIFLGVTWIISRCGWRKVAAGRECPIAPEGTTVSVRNLVFGRFSSYNNVVVATFTPEGIHLRVRWILKPFHPPFLVPWDLVISSRRRAFFRLVLPEFRITDGTTVMHLRLSRDNYRRVEPEVPQRLRGAEDRE